VSIIWVGWTGGGWDTYIYSAQGKKFRSRNEIKRHFEKTGETRLNYTDFNFNAFGEVRVKEEPEKTPLVEKCTQKYQSASTTKAPSAEEATPKCHSANTIDKATPASRPRRRLYTPLVGPQVLDSNTIFLY
jgi:hypothetical protein